MTRASVPAAAGLVLAIVSSAGSPMAAPSAARPRPAAGVVSVISVFATGPRRCRSVGSGLAVGGGLVLTADHVLLTREDLQSSCGLDKETPGTFLLAVRRGRAAPRPADLVAAGRRIDLPAMSFAGSGDDAILRVDGLVAPPHEACTAVPRPGQMVEVALRNGFVAARVASQQTPKTGDDAAYVDLAVVLPQGSSGAGVLDAATHCVMGVVSHRFPEPHPSVTRMTPVAVFAEAWRRAHGDGGRR